MSAVSSTTISRSSLAVSAAAGAIGLFLLAYLGWAFAVLSADAQDAVKNSPNVPAAKDIRGPAFEPLANELAERAGGRPQFFLPAPSSGPLIDLAPILFETRNYNKWRDVPQRRGVATLSCQRSAVATVSVEVSRPFSPCRGFRHGGDPAFGRCQKIYVTARACNSYVRQHDDAGG